ncbi:MAG: type II toxin-antitoxin system RelE/ParE family toxin [Chloroflexi bacterium]|nr:type II toxin-antitoxin system RelE/ParE family toxin [Chloroflexota bacterium]
MYSLKTSPAAERDIRKLGQRISKQDSERLRRAITSLTNEPRSHGVKKIKGEERAYRIRVGTYRVVYEVYDNENLVLISRVLRRTETTYR